MSLTETTGWRDAKGLWVLGVGPFNPISRASDPEGVSSLQVRAEQRRSGTKRAGQRWAALCTGWVSPGAPSSLVPPTAPSLAPSEGLQGRPLTGRPLYIHVFSSDLSPSPPRPPTPSPVFTAGWTPSPTRSSQALTEASTPRSPPLVPPQPVPLGSALTPGAISSHVRVQALLVCARHCAGEFT